MKILVIRNGGIGDTLLLAPFFKKLKDEYYPSELTVMGRKDVLDILEAEKILDFAVSFEQQGVWGFFEETGNLDSGLSHFFSSFQRIFLLVKDEDRCFENNLKKVFSGEIKTAFPLPPSDHTFHASRYYSEVFGFNSLDRFEPFKVRKDDSTRAYEYFNSRNIDPDKDSLVAIHPGSGSNYKSWSLENFREIASYLINKGNKILWVSGPAEIELNQFFRSEKDPVFNIQQPLFKLNSVLKFCSAFLGNDSGISHLAGLAGIPCLVIFGPTDPVQWKPLGPQVKAISKKLKCSPCSREKWKDCGGNECLNGILVKDIFIELEKCI